MQAQQVKIGHCIQTVFGLQKVSTIEKSTEKGIYTIVTTEEYIVVNNVVASPFAVNHYAVNMFYNVFHRNLYKYAPSVMKTNLFGFINVIASQIAFVAAALLTV
jgi:hypothetical protein